MTRTSLLLAASLLAPPALAATDLKAMEGVWKGTIGTLPIRACYDAGEWRNEGKYFYEKHLKTIPLERDRDKAGDLTEGWADTEGVARWTVTRVVGDTLEGQWRGNGRTLPIRLVRVPFETDEEYDRACSSLAFVQPILTATTIVKAPDRMQGLDVERWTLASPDKESVAITSFQLRGTGPAVAAINRRLRKPFEDADEGWIFCLRNAGSFGASYDATFEPTFVTDRWLAVRQSNDSFCGGAHPDASSVSLLFARRSGAEVNLFDWFEPEAVERTVVEDYGTIDKLGPSLLRDVMGRMTFDKEQEECRPSVESASSWDLELTPKGIAFTPSLPHVAQACGDSVSLSWKDLQKYLNANGRREAAALIAGSARR